MNHEAMSVIWRIPRSSKPTARSRSWCSGVIRVEESKSSCCGVTANWLCYPCQMAHRSGVTARAIAETLGGPRALRGSVGTFDDLRQRVEEGLRYESLDALSANLEIGLAAMRTILRLPERTLARRKNERRLRPDESDRLMRIGRIATLAEVTLGSREKAASWLKKKNRALGDRTPLERLDTDLGSREVEDLLLRIAHGVYS